MEKSKVNLNETAETCHLYFRFGYGWRSCMNCLEFWVGCRRVDRVRRVNNKDFVGV